MERRSTTPGEDPREAHEYAPPTGPPQTLPIESGGGPAPPPPEEASLGTFFTRLIPALRAFRYRHYRLLWASNVLSSSGNWMQNAAYGVLIFHLTDSPFLTAFIPASAQLLMGPFGPVGGMLADKRNRRNLLIITQVAFALTTASIGLLVVTGHGTPWTFLAISLVTGIFMAVNFPAYQAFFPRLIPTEELMNAVALNSVSFNLARILGPAAGAVILQTWGTAEVFFVNAATFALFAAVLTRIPSSYGRIEPAGQGGVGGIGDGFRFARRNRTVGTLIVGIGVISVFGLPVIWLAPLMAERIFGNAADTGFILSALGAGAVVGALASGGAAAENKPRVGIVSYFSFALSLAVFAFAPHPAVALPAIAVFGASYMGAAVVINSLVQLATPDGLRGRVMSLYMIAWVGLLPAGAVIAGGLAEVVGVRWGGPVALAAGASVCFLFALRLLLWRDWVPGRFGEARDASPVSE